jgi:hypothetical protein
MGNSEREKVVKLFSVENALKLAERGKERLAAKVAKGLDAVEIGKFYFLPMASFIIMTTLYSSGELRRVWGPPVEKRLMFVEDKEIIKAKGEN